MNNLNQVNNWIIGVSNSGDDIIDLHRVIGTIEQVKKYLFSLVENDKHNDLNSFDFGTDSISKIQKRNNELYAFNNFFDYHKDYIAIPEKPAKRL